MSAFVTAARVVEFTAMAVQFEISWLCTLLFWGCICFPHQKGYIAHGYSLNGNEVSYHDGVFDTQMSNQFDSNTNQDSIRPSDEMQAMRHQSFLSLQREPVNQECNEEFSSVTSLSEDMAQNKPDSEHYVPSAPPVQKYVHDGSGSLHPFGILLKKHTQEQTSGGTSFQTIQDVKRFIETMKRSFLMPGGDKGRHFQTAKETMANEMASNAQNIKGVNPPNSPSQYFSNHLSKPSNIMPLTSENIQQPKYTRYRKPSGGFGNLHHIQSEELNRGTPANVLSYTNNFYVDSPRGQHSIEYLPKERPAKSFQAYQPTFNKESKDINYTPTAHLSVSSGYVSASPVYPSPQSSSGHVSVQTSSPHDAQKEAFTRKQPVSLHRLFTVKPSSSLYGSSRHDDYLQGKIVHFSHPSTLSTQAKDEKPDLFKQHLVSATRGLKQKAGHNLNLISSGFDSTHSGISSWVGDSDANFNSHTNFAPTSASEGAFPSLVDNEVMSRNLGIKNILSKDCDDRDPLGSFSTPPRRGFPINSNDMSANGGGLPQTFRQPNNVWKRPANVKKEPGIINYWPLAPLSASKVSDLTLSDVFYRNSFPTKGIFPNMGPKVSPPFVDAHNVKSRNDYARRKLSKTHYSPY